MSMIEKKLHIIKINEESESQILTEGLDYFKKYVERIAIICYNLIQGNQYRMFINFTIQWQKYPLCVYNSYKALNIT